MELAKKLQTLTINGNQQKKSLFCQIKAMKVGVIP